MGKGSKAVMAPVAPEQGMYVGVLTCLSSLPEEALDTRNRIPSSAAPPGEKPGGTFCSSVKDPAKN